MREIKFRGKRKDNGEWVYGYYLVAAGMPFISTFASKSPIIVQPETVGQFTGIYDKNGKEIYEGDNIILHQFLFDGGEYENQLIGQVIYDDNQACYCLTNIKNEQVQEYMGYKDDYTNFQKETVPINLFYGMHEESFEVIGNIHERAE